MSLAEGVDLLIHDAQYTRVDFGPRAHYGHSTVEYAVGLAEAAGAARLLLFHHDPGRTDEQLDAIVAGITSPSVTVNAAIEGETITITKGGS